MLSITSQINSRIRSTIDDILVYATECRDKISTCTTEKSEANSYYENYKSKTLNNIIEMAERTIKLYDNKDTVFEIILNRLIVSRLNDILRASLENIRDKAIEYKDGYVDIDISNKKEAENREQLIVIEILNRIISTADKGLNLYTDDLIRHSSSENDSYIAWHN